jgi:hypothetical protein
MEIPSISGLIEDRLVKGQPEGETTRVWDGILHESFSIRDGFSTGFEMMSGSGRAGLFTSHIVLEGTGSEKKFLIVECKAPGFDDQPGRWKVAVDQLEELLSKVSSCNRKFGAIAIGKVVRFYELVGGHVMDFEGDGSVYYLDRQCQTITAKLRYFRQNHL